MKFVGVLVAALALGGAAQAKQFVVDGDFTQLSNGVGQLGQNTSAVGWSNSGYNFVVSDANAGGPTIRLWDAANGGATSWNGAAAVSGNYAALDGDYGTGPISQAITGLTPGQKYTLSFWYAFGQQYGYNGATQQTLTASLGNSTWTSPVENLDNHGGSPWTKETLTLTADSASEVLSFLAWGNLPVPPFALVSNVSLTAVPEPATWAMLIPGVAMIGFAARRRVQASALPA